MQRKIFVNEKIDLLYSIILFLILIILMLVGILIKLDLKWLNFSGVFVVLIINFPNYLRRKKQYKKIDVLRNILGLSIEDIRQIADIGRYDLTNWQWDKSYISQKQLYMLEDKLEKMYLIEFKQEFS
ncbi:hypothetical protein [Enterococcus faecalis]|uniref:hypothetical protein n=1 Tax=Enterococcus faecalis TaxID=1351 RepID=UPI002FBD3074